MADVWIDGECGDDLHAGGPKLQRGNCVNTGRFISQKLGVITDKTTLSDSQ